MAERRVRSERILGATALRPPVSPLTTVSTYVFLARLNAARTSRWGLAPDPGDVKARKASQSWLFMNMYSLPGRMSPASRSKPS
ncbi:hypothetical protein HOE425_331578 [Hoeflea sp. EC-HK425]|nr:hypothetical protein HOE425_331578 [Hoeflea sp. EC-HK425]